VIKAELWAVVWSLQLAKEKGTDPLLAVNAINSGRVLTHACHGLVRMVEVLRI